MDTVGINKRTSIRTCLKQNGFKEDDPDYDEKVRYLAGLPIVQIEIIKRDKSLARPEVVPMLDILLKRTASFM